jgi:hypothetical protein
MDKFENETWEDYAFRHELFNVIYADKEKEIIADVWLPNPDKYYSHVFGDPQFTYIIWNKIEEIRIKYDIPNRVADCNDTRFSCRAIGLMSNEDKERQNTLYALKRFWETKWKNICLKKYKRYNELIKTISETHKEQLDELLLLQPLYARPPGETKEYQEYRDAREKEEKYIVEKNKKERIELYQKYLKKKEIRLQIIELHQKINQLTLELV